MAGTTHGPLITAPQALSTTTPIAPLPKAVSRNAIERKVRVCIHARRAGRSAPHARHTCQPRALVRWHTRHNQIAPGDIVRRRGQAANVALMLGGHLALP